MLFSVQGLSGVADTRVNSLSLVRYRTNDYSVPVAYGHQEVWIRGYVHEVVIGCGAGIIARHPRSYDREDMVFDPIHYLPLLEHKIGALDQAAPLAGWELPDAFPTLPGAYNSLREGVAAYACCSAWMLWVRFEEIGRC